MGALIQLWAALITIISWLKKLCNNPLSKLSNSITLPIYVHLIFLFVVVVIAALTIKFLSATPETKEQPEELQIIKGETFGTQQIKIDGKRFVNCKFAKTEFSYSGGSTGFSSCTFDLGHQVVVFEESAAKTLLLLKELYSQEVFRPFVDHVFKSIKEGKLPRAILPSDAADD